MGARIEELLWLRCKFRIQKIANLAAGIECEGIAGPAMRLQKPDETVLMRPDIPVGSVKQPEALVWGVSSEVAIRFHTGNQLCNGLIQLCSDGRITRACPFEGECIQVFANMLTNPRVASGALLEPGEEGSGVHRGKAALSIGCNSGAEPAGHLNVLRCKEVDSVG